MRASGRVDVESSHLCFLYSSCCNPFIAHCRIHIYLGKLLSAYLVLLRFTVTLLSQKKSSLLWKKYKLSRTRLPDQWRQKVRLAQDEAF